ncbi:uncharacterized protein RAG0_16782 [Rhynchosporium agropyri]|uniref:Uncharacterized protein n=1 Tax=Rhynchosporium agropyri TaxID=914238 RepID=A0A1E1LRX6_9HELO|nr:uncharacterized protein RAG0_16782 [Rhynchosporium agropyri]
MFESPVFSAKVEIIEKSIQVSSTTLNTQSEVEIIGSDHYTVPALDDQSEAATDSCSFIWSKYHFASNERPGDAFSALSNAEYPIHSSGNTPPLQLLRLLIQIVIKFIYMQCIKCVNMYRDMIIT